MEGLKTLSISCLDGLTWGDIKEILSTATPEQLQDKAVLWRIDNKKGKVKRRVIEEISVAAEDHINLGEGYSPVSLFDQETLLNEPITLKKGTIIGLI